MAGKINDVQLMQLVEAAIFAADKPLSTDDIQSTVLDGLNVSKKRLSDTLARLKQDYAGRGINLTETASGYRFITRPELSDYLARLWPERSPRYSRAVLETLALIAYRQPITKAAIEAVRGVSCDGMIQKLLDRDLVRIGGLREQVKLGARGVTSDGRSAVLRASPRDRPQRPCREST